MPLMTRHPPLVSTRFVADCGSPHPTSSRWLGRRCCPWSWAHLGPIGTRSAESHRLRRDSHRGAAGAGRDERCVQTLSKSRGAQDEAMFDRLSRMSILANSLGGVLSAVILAIIGSFSDDPLPWMIVALSAFVNGLGWGYGSIAVAKHGWSMVAARRLVSQSAAMVLKSSPWSLVDMESPVSSRRT